MTSRPPAPEPAVPAAESDPRHRIVRAARNLLFAHGVRALTMDALAHELGMSKKTLYVHFAGKEAVLDAVIEDLGAALRGEIDAVLSDRSAGFAARLRRVLAVVHSYLGRATPAMLRELQRYSPRHYHMVERLRAENIPQVFGRLIRDGLAERRVRADLDPDFAAEFWLRAMSGLVQPEAMDRTGLNPAQTLERATGIFLGGLLSSEGRKDYEKQDRNLRRRSR